MLILLQYGFGSRDDKLLVLPYPGNHKLAVSILADLHDRLSEDCRIADLVFSYICVVCVRRSAFFRRFRCKQLLHQHDAQHHSEQSERIGYGAGHGHAVGCLDIVRRDLQERLLACSQHRSVGDGSGEESDGVRSGNVSHPECRDGCK